MKLNQPTNIAAAWDTRM